jgi:UDP-N-acetylglucosamine--N-acetylmuramyl-(pentapeptide) pyrophosphoryl-undecaprenol N-acetylglucosamine transferase
MPSPRVIISGGGTGGHVFPAIAIADALKKLEPDAVIHFVGALGRMEMERVPQAGYTIDGLWISGLQRKLTMKNLSFPFKVVSSLIKARRIISKFDPDVAVGVGGYASGPLLRVANARQIPTVIQEQNSYPGITNRLLGGSARRICVAYPGMDRWFPSERIVFTGNAVREAVTQISSTTGEAARLFNLDADKPTVLVVGGSLGALTINQTIHQHLEDFTQMGYQLIWQTGKNYAPQVNTNDLPEGIRSMPFIERMDLAYAMADLIVSRAGAMSVSEICLIGKASILVPSPNVAEDHQTKNALSLVEAGASVLVSDAEARDALSKQIRQLMDDEAKRQNLAANTAKLAKPNAAENIAREVLNLISN